MQVMTKAQAEPKHVARLMGMCQALRALFTAHTKQHGYAEGDESLWCEALLIQLAVFLAMAPAEDRAELVAYMQARLVGHVETSAAAQAEVAAAFKAVN